ncbi:isoprenylcysteine carboxylmethyltransferase family protein [candidate division KSB1 bacterium]|nr:isoprenylcysteine carboxylmethyltransferase family protein [candidate division KSB1 bacterium]
MSAKIEKGSITKRTFWVIAAFYILIALEFLYMATPFAIYFYSVYGPGLNFINKYPALVWLSTVFLPHIVVETSSLLVNSHNIVGGVFFIIGFLGFCITAGQVYYYKFARKGVVTGGVYNFTRHPQYLSLAICSLGLLLLWPRFIVILPFLAMLFAYYFLAKLEEKECETKFGHAYIEYKNSTGMFLPIRLGLIDKLPSLPKSGFKRFLAMIALYVFTAAVAIALATGIRNWTINSLYALYSKDSVYISVAKVDEETLEQIVKIAISNHEVQSRLKNGAQGASTKFINYVLPNTWYVSEIRMNPVEGGRGHHFPGDYDKNQYKIVFTRAEVRTSQEVEGKDILLHTVKRVPVVEVGIDLAQNQVFEIKDPPATVRYKGIPVPIY